MQDFLPLLTPLFAFALATFSSASLNDPDTFWHLAAGEWIFAHGVPTADPFSFSMPGAPWSAHEWLSEIIFSSVYRIAGWSGVVMLTGAAVAAALLIVTRRAVALGLGGAPLLALMMVSLSLISGSLLARPHVFGLALLAAWVSGLLRARDADRAPPLVLAALMGLWANMHASFLLGLALVGPFALEAIFAARPQRRARIFRDWAIFGLCALAASLLNPQGYDALLYPVRVMNQTILMQITEWRPASFEHFEPMETALLALLGLAFFTPVRLAPFRLAILLGLVHLALHQGRQQMVLAIVAPLLLAGPMAAAFTHAPDARKALNALAARAATTLVVAMVALRLGFPVQRVDSPAAPISALASVPAEIRERPVLNDLCFGGYLIFSHVRPFIDGRTDMYGDAFTQNFFDMTEPREAALDAGLAKYGIQWAMFPPQNPVVKLLARKAGWTRTYANSFAVVFVRSN